MHRSNRILTLTDLIYIDRDQASRNIEAGPSVPPILNYISYITSGNLYQIIR